jgi:hypothetical protein
VLNWTGETALAATLSAVVAVVASAALTANSALGTGVSG